MATWQLSWNIQMSMETIKEIENIATELSHIDNTAPAGTP